MSNQTADEQLAAHKSRNVELRKALEGYGVLMDAGRPCDLNFNCADEASARALAADLEPFGVLCKVNEPFEFGFRKVGWAVAGNKLISPNALMDESLTEQLIRLAIKNRATYDGWGTAITEAASRRQ